MTMRTSHRLLLRLLHDPAFDIASAHITYTDRGAPGDRTTVDGGSILALDSEYFEVATLAPSGRTPIPYHRIEEIRYKDRVIWDRFHGETL